ncbi:MAG: hypothetical protein R3C53_02490 [Pirellulaceae bacterium]
MNSPTNAQDSAGTPPIQLGQLIELIEARATDSIESLLHSHSSGDLARAVSRLDDEQRGTLIELIGAESAADLLEQLPSVQAINCWKTLHRIKQQRSLTNCLAIYKPICWAIWTKKTLKQF